MDIKLELYDVAHPKKGEPYQFLGNSPTFDSLYGEWAFNLIDDNFGVAQIDGKVGFIKVKKCVKTTPLVLHVPVLNKESAVALLTSKCNVYSQIAIEWLRQHNVEKV